LLMFASHSWIEPFLYLAVIGVSILLNMGSNIVFPSISFITHAMAAVLQLAISMDYSLFICHRYTEERSNGLEPLPAVLAAAKKSVKSISASSTTTIAGFLALIFMHYSIGADIGLVLAKGILISYLTVLILMPLLLYSCRNLIEKSKHRQFLPSFKKFGHSVVKLRYLIIALVLIVAIPSFLAQRNNTYLYGDTSGSSGAGEYAQQRQRIDDLFGTTNPVMLLVPNTDLNGEIALCAALKASPLIKNVTALVTVADPAIPREFLPQAVRDNFLSQDYSRIIVNLTAKEESPESYGAVEFIESAVQKYYPDKWLAAGTATSMADIKSTVETDNLIVSIFSLAAVGIIILLTFRSLTLPILLVAVIQIAIWINMGVPYFTGSSLVFIGYLVIKSLQLGATIDYAILLTNRYMDFRLQHLPREAAALALRASGGSVLTSALILSLAGYAEGLMSKIDAISTIGMLLGRGAALSGILVLTLLPVLLTVFDPVIISTTLGTKLIRHKEKRSA
ncbi:MAG TPA: RND transporter, partial [Firmicutes bacterium]|nr:RND transporter [Bacillota bacterium]